MVIRSFAFEVYTYLLTVEYFTSICPNKEACVALKSPMPTSIIKHTKVCFFNREETSISITVSK